MTKEKREIFRIIIWFNLFIGLYNLYLYTSGNWLFNLLIGSTNIGIWVFNRNFKKKS